MDWKQAVIPTSTKPGAAVTPSSAPSTAPIDAKSPSSEQYVYCDSSLFYVNKLVLFFSIIFKFTNKSYHFDCIL